MPEEFMGYKVYGPYTSSIDGRERVILYKNRKRRTMSYPKFLVWKETGNLIADNEHVHHKDENPQNNNIDNFEITNIHKHGALHTKQDTFICKWCSKEFTLKGGKLSNHKSNRLKNKVGPFCGRPCAGKYGTYVQYVINQQKSAGGRKPYKYKNMANRFLKWREQNGNPN